MNDLVELSNEAQKIQQYLDQKLRQLIPKASFSKNNLNHVLDTNSTMPLMLATVDDSVTLTADEIGAIWSNFPYWAFAWAGGIGLAEFILLNPELVKNKRVVDFGCGSGIAAIAAALTGAEEVICCDLDDDALLASALNIELNCIGNPSLNQIKFSYSNDISAIDDIGLLLAADVLYDISAEDDLFQTLQRSQQCLFAETQQMEYKYDMLSIAYQATKSTLPRVGDFDEAMDVVIFTTD